MKISSSAFKDGGRIPLKYVMPAAGGENISPPLSWEGIPKKTRSLLLICIDPHPVAHNWIHWLVINIPPQVKALPEGASKHNMPIGCKELQNSFGFVGYGGPQPPPGTGDHPYVFTLLALDIEKLSLPSKVTWKELQQVLAGHILAQASITGYFSR